MTLFQASPCKLTFPAMIVSVGAVAISSCKDLWTSLGSRCILCPCPGVGVVGMTKKGSELSWHCTLQGRLWITNYGGHPSHLENSSYEMPLNLSPLALFLLPAFWTPFPRSLVQRLIPVICELLCSYWLQFGVNSQAGNPPSLNGCSMRGAPQHHQSSAVILFPPLQKLPQASAYQIIS